MEICLENANQTMTSNISSNEILRKSKPNKYEDARLADNEVFDSSGIHEVYREPPNEIFFTGCGMGINSTNSCPRRRPTICTSRKILSKYQTKIKRQAQKPVKPVKKMRPGPLTNNAYLNYVRHCRRKYGCLGPKQVVILAAYEWRSLSPRKKAYYQRQASAVKYSKLHKKCY